VSVKRRKSTYKEEKLREYYEQEPTYFKLKAVTDEDLDYLNNGTVRRTLFIEGARYIMSSLIYAKLYNESEMQRLNASVLKSIIGNDYSKIMDALDGNIIHKVTSYRSGYYSTGYVLERGLLAQGFNREKYTHRPIIKSIYTYKRERFKEQNERIKRLPHLTGWADRAVLKTDSLKFYDNALGIIEYLIVTQQNGESRKQLADRLTSLQQNLTYSIQVMNGKNSYSGFKRDDQGRFYSGITNLSKFFRGSIMIPDYGELWNIDLKNSQPFHLLALLRDNFYKTGKHLNCFQFRYLKTAKHHATTAIRMREVLPKLKDNQDMIAFQGHILNGTLYEELVKKLGKGNPELFGSRGEAKGTFLQLMYRDPKKQNPKMHEAWKQVERLFPSVVLFINTLKEDHYKYPSLLLQAIEAHLILEVVTKSLAKKYPFMPMLTIHDSVITDEEHKQLLKDQIDQTYIDKIGFKPTLALEKLEERYSPLDVINHVLGKAADFNLNQNKLKDIIMRTKQLDCVNEGLDFGMQEAKVRGADVKEFKGLDRRLKKVYIPNLQALKQALGE
jgi:hypothetical protein